MNSADQVIEVKFDDENVYLRMEDGRVVGNPLDWHVWLREASDEQRTKVEMYEMSVYFPDLDDGLDVAEMMKGIPPHFLRKQGELAS